MQITQFINKISDYTPKDWNYWAGINRTDYNREKQVKDTMLLILPRNYPIFWRPNCIYKVNVEFWFGKVRPLFKSALQMQQHNPNEPIENKQALHTTAEIFISQLNEDSNIQIHECSDGEFFYSSEGKSINSQYWLRVKATLKISNFDSGFDYITDLKFN